MKILYILFVFVLKVNGQITAQHGCDFDKNVFIPNHCEKFPNIILGRPIREQDTSIHLCAAINNQIFRYATLEIGFEYDLGSNTIQHFRRFSENTNDTIQAGVYKIIAVELPILNMFMSKTLPQIISIKLDGVEMCSKKILPSASRNKIVSDHNWPSVTLTEYMHKCQTSLNRVYRAPTRCINSNGIMVDKLRFDNEFHCIIVDRTYRFPSNQWDELYIEGDELLIFWNITAIWTGNNPIISERTTFRKTFAFNLTSERFYFVYQHIEDNSPEIRIKLNNRDTCGRFINMDDFKCGIRKIQHRGLITFGASTYHGKYPWHAAIYKIRNDTALSYICGGNIISTNAVLTAAHCVQNSNGITASYMLRVQLGKYDLLTSDSDTREYRVAEVIPHSEYDMNYYENDIAILKLETYITYSNYIQPICIYGNDNQAVYTNQVGYVPGWGRNEMRARNPELREAAMPIVDDQECRRSKRDFYPNFLNSRNFCAGYRNGTNVCDGDSGGGLVFDLDDGWHLKGIVSMGVAIPELGCDILEYVLFTDVTKYVDWIKAAI